MNHYANRTLIVSVLRIKPKSRAKVCAQWRILKPPGSLLATACSKRVVLVVLFLLYGSGSITSVWEERYNLSAVVYLYLCGFCLERFLLPRGAWDVLRYVILTLPEPSI